MKRQIDIAPAIFVAEHRELDRNNEEYLQIVLENEFTLVDLEKEFPDIAFPVGLEKLTLYVRNK